MLNFNITEEERAFILKRRELMEKRKKNQQVKDDTPKDVILGKNRPKNWDSHCHPCQVHQGRMTEKHPLYWFESEIFKNISNMQHKEQHKKITEILNVPVQNVFRDRQYHALCHLDALWEQELLPLKYKHKYELFKKEHNIGDDNVHPNHKKQKPDYDFPIPMKKRDFSFELYPSYNEEKFIAGKKYIYEKVS